MNNQYVKKIVKSAFNSFGFEVKKNSKSKVQIKNKTKSLPPLFDEPLEALAYQQSDKGIEAAFWCPLDYTVKQNGLSYSPKRWHPFVETLREFEAGITTSYEGSILEKYYKTHQPSNAAEAIVGFNNAPPVFQDQPAHVYRLSPWRVGTPKDVDDNVKLWTRNESLIHCNEEITIEADGYNYHGPVSAKKGRFEYQRLIRIFKIMKMNGYDRKYGHANFLLLRRGETYRYLSAGNGNHRTAAMAALGYKTIPAVFRVPGIIDVNMVNYWPQVRCGLWSNKQAIKYFNHLFDFDSHAWARKRGLLLEQVKGVKETS